MNPRKIVEEIDSRVDQAIFHYEKIIDNDPERELYYERVDLLNLKDIKERLAPILDKMDYNDCEWSNEFLDEAMTMGMN